jgi:hypothetical protein
VLAAGNQNPGNQNPGNHNPGNQNPGNQNSGMGVELLEAQEALVILLVTELMMPDYLITGFLN